MDHGASRHPIDDGNAGHPEALAGGDEELRRGGEAHPEAGGGGGRPDRLLEVVEDEQERPAGGECGAELRRGVGPGG